MRSASIKDFLEDCFFWLNVLLFVGIILAIWIGLSIVTDGAIFSASEPATCFVHEGRALPVSTPTSSHSSGSVSGGESCQSEVYQALYFGEHHIPCFLGRNSRVLSISQLAKYELLSLGVLSIVLLLMCLPLFSSRRAFRNLRRDGDAAKILEMERRYIRQARQLLVFLPAALIFSLSALQQAVNDVGMDWSRDWVRGECTLIARCEPQSASDSAGMVYERDAGSTRYRSSYLNGFREESRIPAVLSAWQIGERRECFFDPNAPAHMRAVPTHAFSLSAYGPALSRALFVAVLFYLLTTLKVFQPKSA